MTGHPAFQTLDKPGCITQQDDPASWFFSLGLAEAPVPPRCIMMAEGFALTHPGDAASMEAIGMMVAPGALAGQATRGMAPLLSSDRYPVHAETGGQTISTDNRHIFLLWESTDTGAKFCLSISATSPEDARDKAQQGLKEDVPGLFAIACAKRIAFWTLPQSSEVDAGLLNLAVEGLIGRIRPAIRQPYMRWASEGDANQNVFNINRIYPLAKAWCLIDTEIAAELVQCALKCCQPDGRLPGAVHMDDLSAGPCAAWPLLAQAAWHIWTVTQDPAFARKILPDLSGYLRWILDYFDPSGSGHPMWRSAEESLAPEVYDEGVVSVGLCALLLCELTAYHELCEAIGNTNEADAFNEDRLTLILSLQTVLSDPNTMRFYDRYTDGNAIKRISISGVLPLLWTGLHQSFRDSLIRQLANSVILGGEIGVLAWVPWENDPMLPPILSAHQVLIMEALRRLGGTIELQLLSRKIAKGLMQRHRSGAGLPYDLQPCPAEGGQAPSVYDLTTLALTVLVAIEPVLHIRPVTRIEKAVRHLDLYRRLIMGVALSILAIVIVTVSIVFMARNTLPRQSIEVMSGLARQYESEGNYEKALSLYRDLLKGSRNSAVVESRIGNVMFKKGAYSVAEAHYRKAISSPNPPPAAWMNLALSLFKQKRYPEALQAYRECVENHAAAFPVLAARATLAAQLIQDHYMPAQAPVVPSEAEKK